MSVILFFLSQKFLLLSRMHSILLHVVIVRLDASNAYSSTNELYVCGVVLSIIENFALKKSRNP